MKLRSVLIGASLFVAGAAAGAVASYLFLERSFDKKLEDAIADEKEAYREALKKRTPIYKSDKDAGFGLEGPSKPVKEQRDDNRVPKGYLLTSTEPPVVTAPQMASAETQSPPEDGTGCRTQEAYVALCKKIRSQPGVRIYPVTEPEFIENIWKYDEETLVYDWDDQILYDQDGQVVNVEDVIGEEDILPYIDFESGIFFFVNTLVETRYAIELINYNGDYDE